MEPTNALMTTEEIRTFVFFLCGSKPSKCSIGGVLQNRGLFPITVERINIAVKHGRKGSKRFVKRAYYDRDAVISAFKGKPYPRPKGFPRGRKRLQKIPRAIRQESNIQTSVESAQVINFEYKIGRKFDCEHYCECLDYATIGHIVDAKRVKRNFGCHKCDRYKKKEL